MDGWRTWQSSDGRGGGWWYGSRTGPVPVPGERPEGWAATVFGRTEGDLRAEIARQVALDRITARRLAAAPGPPAGM